MKALTQIGEPEATARKLYFQQFLDIACQLNSWIDRTGMEKDMEQALAQIDAPDQLNTPKCSLPPEGWECTRAAGHEGTCAAIPKRQPLQSLAKCPWCSEGSPEWSPHANVWIHRRERIDKRCLNPPLLAEQKVPEVQHERLKIYVASRASIPERAAMWRRLRSEGYNIVSTWIDEDGEGQTASWTELWSRIQVEISACDRLVFYAEPSDLPLRGAFVEAGIAIGLGKPVFAVTPGILGGRYGNRPIGSWLAHPLVTVCKTLDAAMQDGKA